MPDDQEFHLDPSVPLAESFKTIPADFKKFLRRGFASLTNVVARGQIADLAKRASEAASTGPTLSKASGRDLAVQYGVGREDVPSLISAAVLCTAAVVAQKKLTADEFVKMGLQVGFIAPNDEANARALADAIVNDRDSLRKISRRARLEKALLPSLTSFNTVVELRPSFVEDDSAINFAVPVVIAHIGNDSADDAWVQMSKAQVQQLIGELQDALRRIGTLEKWAATMPFSNQLPQDDD